jgi:lipopolysaccharide/colanic/teichoic acid biosynthesis glycosyltransferase
MWLRLYPKLLSAFVCKMIKRLFDFLSALIGLIVLSPLFLITSLIIKLTSPGPVFHRGERVGLNGKLFNLYKFRTMIANAATLGPGITPQNDTRITGVGRFLRRTKIDELPQLINVLTGDMSLVGPRPEDPRYIAQYTPEQREVLKFRPGITSAASLAFRKEEKMLAGLNWERIYCTEVLPSKLAMDLAYLSHRTLLSDILLIIRTILSIFH